MSESSITDESLADLLGRFLDVAESSLRGRSAVPAREGLRLVHDASGTLVDRVTALESTEEFRSLCQGVKARLGGVGYGSMGGWDHAIGHWLRRRGVYHRVAAGERPTDLSGLLGEICAELSRENGIATHFALLEHVYFSKERMDFGRYEITRFTKADLDRLLETDVRAVFYPWSAVPTNELCRYWWLVVRASEGGSRIGKITMNLADIDVVTRSYSSLPFPVEDVVRELAFFDWRPDFAKGGGDPRWDPFGIPFSLRADARLAATPRGPRADLTLLDTEPDWDPETGEEDGERPVTWFHFDEKEVAAFEEFVRVHGGRLHRALTTDWSKPLVETASNFFVKAFTSDGIEQLLWHITTIEALVGEKGEGVVDRLARRIAAALGAEAADQKRIRKTFKDLYDFRSELVHGRPSENAVLTEHLFEARQLARGLLLWFIRFVDDVQQRVEAEKVTSDLPERNDVLRLLDLGYDGLRKARWLLPALPATFPRYPDIC